MVTTLFI